MKTLLSGPAPHLLHPQACALQLPRSEEDVLQIEGGDARVLQLLRAETSVLQNPGAAVARVLQLPCGEARLL